MHRKSSGNRLELTARDLDIFRLLNRYRFLRSSFIRAFFERETGSRLQARLGDLYHEGYLNRPEQQWQFINARYMPAIYELDRKGEQVLKDYGYYSPYSRVTTSPGRTGPHHQFAHDLMVCDILASIELGVKANPALSFISVYDILERAPETTRDAKLPLAMPAGKTAVIPDGLFGIRTAAGVLFFALEADRQNEPIRRKLEGTSYAGKLTAYAEIIREGVYKAHFNLPNLQVLHVTSNATHMQNIMAVAPQARFFLYKTMGTLGQLGKAPEPDAHMLTKPWARVGHEAITIIK